MKKIRNLIAAFICGFCFIINVQAQDKVFASFHNAQKIKSITVNGSTGASNGNFGSSISVNQTAAIGYYNNNGVGYLLSLEYTSDDKVDIYAVKADGTGSNTKIKNDADIANGSKDLDYVRLGIDHNNIGWIVSKESNSNDIYVASFTWNGSINNPSVTVTKRGKLNTNDNTNNLFINGDLAIASNTLFVLANNGSGSTKIYTITLNNLVAANSNSISSLTTKWDLRDGNGNKFVGSVNGFAFASTGSAYLSTAYGLYFIDQFSTNFSGTGTVKCTLIDYESDLSDLATSYIPVKTGLPVKITEVKAVVTHTYVR
jgi:hypothetical protein